MSKKGYVIGIGSLVIAIIFFNLMFQISLNLYQVIFGIVGVLFSIIGLGCIFKPEIFVPFSEKLFENLARTQRRSRLRS